MGTDPIAPEFCLLMATARIIFATASKSRIINRSHAPIFWLNFFDFNIFNIFHVKKIVEYLG